MSTSTHTPAPSAFSEVVERAARHAGDLLFATLVTLGVVMSGTGTGLERSFARFGSARATGVFFVLLAGALGYRHLSDHRVRRTARRAREAADRELADAKDEFLANVSHGLRTPLTGIVGFAHMMKEQAVEAEAHSSLDIIIGESAELSRMVDDLITAARVDAGALEMSIEDVSAVEQVEQVTAFLALMAADVTVDCDDARLAVDGERFRQILRNLLVNAHRHGEPQVKVSGRVRGDRYVCDIVDHGPGLSDHLRDELFTRFTRREGSRITGSLGLGLSVSRELARRMGAEVSYRRIRGETHFVVSAPLAVDSDRPLRPRLVHTPERIVRFQDRLVSVPA